MPVAMPVIGPEIKIRLVLRAPSAEDFKELSGEVRARGAVEVDHKLVAAWIERLSGIPLVYLEQLSLAEMRPCIDATVELLLSHQRHNKGGTE